MNTAVEFDIGPLSWVRGEIGNALDAVIQALNETGEGSLDALSTACTHLHQATGAIDMVGLNGVARVCTEAEALISAIARHETEFSDSRLEAARSALSAIPAYLDEVLDTGENRELKLAPLLTQLARARGAEHVKESELFFPDLSVRVPQKHEGPILGQFELAALVRRGRARFQLDLLHFLRGEDTDRALQGMLETVSEIEQVVTQPAARTFWWAAIGFVECLIQHGIEPDFTVKQLCGRIDLQMRKLMQGSQQVAEGLLRDILYFIAVSRSTGERAEAVRTTFELTQWLPPIEDGARAAWLASHRPLLKELREALASTREAWLKISAGQKDMAGIAQETLTRMHQKSGGLENPALTQLLDRMREVAGRLPLSGGDREAAVELEMATAILLLQNTLEQYDSISGEFANQADVQGQRLLAAVDSSVDPATIPDVPLLDEMSRRAQERILMAQVTGEIQANLNHVEEVLDRFFRDPEASRDDLPQTANWLTQIHGALSLLQLATADQLFLLAKDQIERFAEPDAPIDRTDLDWVAEAFSALRLYLEAVRFGHSDDDSLLQPTLRKRMPQAAPEPVPGDEEPSIEKTLEDNRRGLEESLMLDVGLDEPEKKKIHDALSSIRDDAELAGNVTLRAHAQSALNLLREQESPDPDAIKLALNPDTTVATDIEFAGGDEAQQTVDAELLQVYLEEAEEVLERIRQNLDACRQDPGDLDALTVIRRGFHTLKGSGRMVGLVDLGEVAWELEQTMNSWVQEERPAIPRLLDMIGHAYDSFRMWIKALTENGHARVNAESLAASARALRTGEPTTAESAVSHLSAETTETATGESATETPAAMGGTLEPEPETSSVEPTQTWEAADILGEIGSEIAEASPEVAELMAADPAADAAEELFAEPVHEIPETVGEDLFEPGIPAEGPTPESEQAAEIEQIPMADEVIIGEHRIAAALFDIFLQEAGQHLATLNAHQRRLESVPPPAVEQEFVRAAHTLAGISRTTGFAPLAELAHALERWLMALVETPVPPMSEHVEISRAAIQAMGEMLVALSIQKWPGEAPGICAGLVGAADVVRQGFVPAETAASGDQTEVQECETLLQSTPQATPNRRLIRDDLDPQLLPIFLEEAAEIYPNISALMRTWQGRPQDAEVSRELQRALHTFKGSARMAGALRLGELTHKMESEVLAATETGQYGTETFEELFSKLDRMEDALEALKQPLPETPELPEQVAEASVEVASVPPWASALVPAALANVAESELRARQALRIRDDVLDRLVNEAGEVAIARSRLETETSSIKHTVIDLTENLNRLRGQLRDLEIQAESQMQSRLTQLEESSGQFDPLEFDRFTRLQELTRMMAESVNDIGTVQSGLLTNIGQAEAAINQQARMTRELQRALMSIRLTPLATLTERLHKVVRRTAKELEKKVNLDLTGMHVEIDRSVLEKIVGPLEHLLRNAVAHGIEMPDARRAAGKAELGEILMVVRQEGSEVTLTLSDDGTGLNLDRIRQRAIDSGLLNPSVIPSAGQLADLIFRPGFSTAEHVSEVAGRGIGMDVVRSEIAGLGGRVEVSTESGKGTRFTITLPVNLAVTHVVLVEADGGLYAIPSTTVEQVREIKANELPTLYEQGQIRWMENDYPMHYLPWMLGHSGIAAPAQRHNKLLLLKSGAKRVAVQVDSMAGNREVVVKPIGPQLARVAGISGATVLGDGRIVLIINPVDMAERASRASEATTVETPVQVVARQETTPLAMIVDDSLTVRRLTSRLLERAGYRVVTAKDGQDALERLHDELPDVILLDIEMPRMDGFEFTRHARADSRSAGIPIIMITSRTAEKHRTHAYELGVNAYLGKPYQEDELLAEMRALLTAAEKAKVSATAAV